MRAAGGGRALKIKVACSGHGEFEALFVRVATIVATEDVANVGILLRVVSAVQAPL